MTGSSIHNFWKQQRRNCKDLLIYKVVMPVKNIVLEDQYEQLIGWNWLGEVMAAIIKFNEVIKGEPWWL